MAANPIKRTDLDALADAEEIAEFEGIGDVLVAMRKVVRKVGRSRDIEVTDDPFEFLSTMVKLMKYTEPGVYAMVLIDEDRPPEEPV